MESKLTLNVREVEYELEKSVYADYAESDDRKNRFAMTAMHLLYTEDGSSQPADQRVLSGPCEGGRREWIIVGGAAADPYIGYSHMLRMDQDRFVPRLEGIWRMLSMPMTANVCAVLTSAVTAEPSLWKGILILLPPPMYTPK